MDHLTDFDRQHGISSVIEALRDPGAQRIFLHCYMTQPNLAPLARIAIGCRSYPERAILLARAQDVVCVKEPVDREYPRFLAGLGPFPGHERTVAADPSSKHTDLTSLSQQIASDPKVIEKIGRLLMPEASVYLDCYMFTEAEARLGALLESALGRRIRATGGNAPAIADANLKHVTRAKARELGIPVAPGDVVELPLGPDGHPLNLRPLEDAVRAFLPLTGRAIVRGAQGASGVCNFVVGLGAATLQETLPSIRGRADNSIYLVEAMLPVTVSPNVGLYISPVDGGISCVSVTDQILAGGVNYTGNTYPSRAANIDGMIASARLLAEWLRGRGVTGHLGFDFCEYQASSGGGTEFILSEINPRVNGATYARALMEKVNMGQLRAGAPPVGAFATGFIGTSARNFAELREVYARFFFNPAVGAGVVPFNTGCLHAGRCVFAILGGSLDGVRDLQRAISGAEPAAAAPSRARVVSLPPKADRSLLPTARPISEFAAVPSTIIVHDPVRAGAFEPMLGINDPGVLEKEFLYRAPPDPELYSAQHGQLVEALEKYVKRVVCLHDLVGDHEFYAMTRSNPNYVFTRDSLITIPWVPYGYIRARMKPPLRRSESSLLELAVRRLGLREILSLPEDVFLEGGDVIPFARNGRRTLLVGYGQRTSLPALHFLQRWLIPEFIDEIIGIELAHWRMNLDGGLVPASNDVIVSDTSSILRSILLDRDGCRDVDVFALFHDLGMHVIDTTPSESVYYQSCNYVCVGNRTVIYYDLCERVRSLLLEHGVNVRSIPGGELVKGRGGPRCMTRPIYTASPEG